MVQFYTYNKTGVLTSVKKTENKGVTLQEFGLDSLNRIVSISNFRISIDENGKLLKKTEMNKETIQRRESRDHRLGSETQKTD